MGWRDKTVKKLVIPYYPEDDNEGYYDIYTLEEKTVSDYSGYSFKEIEELNIVMFWLLLRDAVIYRHSRTKEGLEYLEKCWMLEQDKPDRQSLRETFGKKGAN